MEPFEALRLEGGGLGGRIVVENRGLLHVALHEANAAAVLQVDRRKQDHGRHFRKLAISARPSFWLFSGWNCVPAMLSAGHDRGHRPAIVGHRRDIVLLSRRRARRSARNRRAGRLGPVSMPSSSGCSRWAWSVFQPICGILSAGVVGLDRRSRRPGSSRAPAVVSYSRPRLAMSCMPTQMPRNGRPLPRTASVSASTMPGTASSPRRQSAKAPTPGSTMRSAFATALRVGGDDDRLVESGLARGALEGLVGGMEVARAVIDDRDAHRDPLRLREQADHRLGSTSAGRAEAGAAGPEPAPAAASRCRASARRPSVSASSRSRAATTSTAGSPRRARVQRRRLFASRPIRKASSSQAAKAARRRRHARLAAAPRAAASREHDQAREPEPVDEEPQEREEERAPGEAVLTSTARSIASASPAAASAGRCSGVGLHRAELSSEGALGRGHPALLPRDRARRPCASARARPLKQLSAIWWLLSP